MTEALIVVSTPRSGSSWLSRILREHPDLHVYTHNTNNTQLLYLLYPIKTFNPFSDDAIGESTLSDRLLKGIRIRTVKTYYRSSSPARRLVLASPTNVEFLPLLKEVFPTAGYVHLKRNPLDVIASFRSFLAYNGSNGVRDRFKKFKHKGYFSASKTALTHLFHSMRWLKVGEPGYVGTRPPGFQEAARLPILEFLSWYYFRLEAQIEQALAQVPADRKHSISYEGLVTNHETELRNLMDFMGVDISDEYLQSTSAKVKSDGIGRHRKAFTQEELERIKLYLVSEGIGCAEADPVFS